MERDFYGVVRTRDRRIRCRTARCTTAASCTADSCSGDDYRNTPSDYFGPGSGYGRLFAALNEMQPGAAQRRRHRARRRRGGVVRPAGRHLHVLRDLAARGRHRAPEFTFLRDTPAKTDVVLGDGRLSLEREAPRALRRAGHRRVRRRFDSDASGDARGDGAVRASISLPTASSCSRRPTAISTCCRW